MVAKRSRSGREEVAKWSRSGRQVVAKWSRSGREVVAKSEGGGGGGLGIRSQNMGTKIISATGLG